LKLLLLVIGKVRKESGYSVFLKKFIPGTMVYRLV